ncbi:predicted protein [Naegleria gruberi]|uniref:Predicted protein n=1 Tax=Naegleria gruberi TaxID=5762 RepID=D2VR04_NAEGR|nr:uncharacterized protein NAEGRDRAFT_71413 [Naegleria gruberi]EFC40804.1 predicted protein [Naegleria gruberi]|eukprot:XP_002673548.1 predicted protein [Naegleria gruberi strain NEG-M]
MSFITRLSSKLCRVTISWSNKLLSPSRNSVRNYSSKLKTETIVKEKKPTIPKAEENPSEPKGFVIVGKKNGVGRPILPDLLEEQVPKTFLQKVAHSLSFV